MKQLVCEMCGSKDLAKQDGFFVCQSCGIKYSVEEAKKMMIEGTVEVQGTVAVQGTVEVQGTVKVDGSDELNKLYQLARRAKDENNAADARKYYDEIVTKDPNSWEASFYAIYFKAIDCEYNEMVNYTHKLTDRSDSVFKLIKEYVTDPKEQRTAVDKVAAGIIKVSKKLLDRTASFFYDYPSDYLRQRQVANYVNRVSCATVTVFLAGDKIVKYFDFTYGDIAAACWQAGINLENTLKNYSKKMLFKELVEYNNTYKPNNIAGYSTRILKYNREETLRLAKADMNKGLFSNALSKLQLIKGWKPADELIPTCEQKEKETLEQLEKEHEEELKAREAKKAEKSKKMKKIALIVTPTICAIAAIVLLLIFVIIPSSRYSKAVGLLDAGNTEEAYKIFNALGDYKDSKDQAGFIRFERTKESLQSSTITVGSIIKIGAYEQDGKKSNGKEDIEWVVIHVDDSGMALVISKYVLDAQPYHNKDEDTTWENCSLRQWLNDDFAREAFTLDELGLICVSEVQPHTNKAYPKVKAGNATYDALFLLSMSEFDAYLKSSQYKEASATKYADTTGYWMLRTPGRYEDYVSLIDSSGYTEASGHSVSGDYYNGIRPAFWIDLNTIE